MRFLTLQEVVRLTTLSRETIRVRERDGLFPRRRRISPGRIGWLESEINLWIEARR